MSGRAALVLSLVLGFPLTAFAQENSRVSRAAARDLGTEGVAAYKRGAYLEALDKLQRAYEVVRVPTLGLWSARALMQLGRWVEASERYLEVSRLDPNSGANAAIQEKAKADAQQELAELRPRIPGVSLTVQGVSRTEVSLSLDGGELPAALVGTTFSLDPGKHQLEVRYADQVQHVEIAGVEGKVVPVSVRFHEVAPSSSSPRATTAASSTSELARDEPSNPQRTLGFVAVGVGSAGLLIGGVYGALAIDQHGDLEQSCQSGHCFASKADEVESYNTARSVSSIGLIAGGVIGLAGLVVVLTAPTSHSSLSLVVSPRSLALRGAL
jgi:hypothetical protein